jgi:hypothetical protein
VPERTTRPQGNEIMRLYIDGRWTTSEMARELSALDYLYNVASIMQSRRIALLC